MTGSLQFQLSQVLLAHPELLTEQLHYLHRIFTHSHSPCDLYRNSGAIVVDALDATNILSNHPL
jgi:hypothetical protein